MLPALRAYPNTSTPAPPAISEEHLTMPTSKKKAAANRKNSKRSTGPKTDKGKARSAMNARTHGLLARDAVHPQFDSDNDCAEFATLCARMLAWYRPLGPVEELLVDKINVASWRLKKALRYEAACTSPGMYDDQLDAGLLEIYDKLGASNLQRRIKEELKDQPMMAGAVGELRAIIPLSHQTTLLLRYEGAANRDMYRAMAELRRVRKEASEREPWTEPGPAENAPPRGEHHQKYQTKPNRGKPSADEEVERMARVARNLVKVARFNRPKMEAAIAAAKTDRENCETKPNPESIRQMLGLFEPPAPAAHPVASAAAAPSADEGVSTSG
jgi:hypothetical protein